MTSKMNSKLAYEILELNSNVSYDEKLIKKKYHSLCLKYHPDKNLDNNECKEKFQQINEAYQFLTTNFFHPAENFTYENHLHSVLDTILPKYLQTSAIYQIISNIIQTCEKLTLLKLQKLDVNTLEMVYKLLYVNKELLYIKQDIFDKVKTIIQEKRKNDECIKLVPTINDLLLNNIYKLVIDGETYMIPLWHKQLVYEHRQNELYVKCQPKLDNNIVIDEKNNISLDVYYKLNNVWKQPYLYFELGEQTFEIPTNQLYMVPKQTYTLYNQGITRINKQNIYDVTKKGHIYVTINVE
tara:strand:- start:5562 stop:6452 length:891 start_codon:yes stop_codon:yes gene_type:complete